MVGLSCDATATRGRIRTSSKHHQHAAATFQVTRRPPCARNMAMPLRPGLVPSEVAFLCEMELVTIVPRQRLDSIALLSVSASHRDPQLGRRHGAGDWSAHNIY